MIDQITIYEGLYKLPTDALVLGGSLDKAKWDFVRLLSSYAKGNDHLLICKGLPIYKQGDEVILCQRAIPGTVLIFLPTP